MRSNTQTCLILLIGVLTSFGSGGTIGKKDSRIYYESEEDSNQSGEEQTAKYPIWKTDPVGSPQHNFQIISSKVGGTKISRVTPASGSNLQLPVNTSSGVAQQTGTSEPSMVVKPLLDEDELVAFEINKMKTTMQPPTSATPPTGVTVVASQPSPDGDKVIPSQLEDIFKSILDESIIRRESTTQRPKFATQRPREPPKYDATSQNPPVGSTVNGTEFQEFIPQIEEVLKSVLVKDKPEVSQPPSPTYLPPPQQPKLPVSNGEEDQKQILPAIEEVLGSILKDSEVKVPTTTRWPVLPTVHPTTTTNSRQHFAAVLPQLEDAIRSVLEEAVLEEEAKAQRHTTHRPPPTQQQGSQTTKDYGFGNFLPELEQMFGDILRNQGSNHSVAVPDTAGTVKMPTLPATTTTSEQPHFQDNIIETGRPLSVSEPLFQAVKSTLEDVLNQQELETRKPQTGP